VSYIIPVAQEQASDSSGTKLWKSLLTAFVVLVAILLTTILFVILYKYRCLKIIYGWLITSSLMLLAAFGGYFFYLLLESFNLPFDAITFSFLLWNFAVVGILAIFWHGPTKVNQGYLIIISGLLAIFFTKLPEWTTFAILAVVAVYDIVAVLSPCGPLRVLVETAQQRQEPIPALLYNASVYFFMADRTPPEPSLASQTQSSSQAAQQPAAQSKRKGVKLGLGDFIFYSVLIGRAALFDMITVFSCFVGIITGLFFTLLLLAIFRKALPALPISITFGILFYFLTRMFLLPFVITLGENQIFV
jgi:cell division protein FtsL